MYFWFKQKSALGFTLIELLIVVAIIGILSGILFVSIGQGPLRRARDARRIADFKNFRLAMTLYADKYGKYPTSPNNCCNGGLGGDHNQNFKSVANILVSEGFLSAVPEDPSASAPGSNAYMLYDYTPGTTGGEVFLTYLEGIDPTTIGPFGSCRPFTNNWCSHTDPTTAYCICM